MRGPDQPQTTTCSYLCIEDRIPADHPLRAIQALVNPILRELSPRFQTMYARQGRPSIPPERLLRALLLQTLYTIRSERQLMEELDYNLLFRWFVRLNPDDPVWVPTVFTKNRDRLIAGHMADAFLHAILKATDERGLLSDEHFTVDGTLLEAWASQKSLRTTNLIESVMARLDEKTQRVDYWRTSDQKLRWCGAALLAVEKHFRRVKGYQQLHLPVKVLGAKMRRTTEAAA